MQTKSSWLPKGLWSIVNALPYVLKKELISNFAENDNITQGYAGQGQDQLARRYCHLDQVSITSDEKSEDTDGKSVTHIIAVENYRKKYLQYDRMAGIDMRW